MIKKAIVVTFRSVDAAASVGLVSSDFTFEDFQHFISRDRWDVVEMFFRVARLSIEERERVKEAFMVYLRSIEGDEMKLTRKWKTFLHLLEETNDPSNRCSEDETPTEAEKTPKT
ncbi:hypothetical protein AVEN_85598-1 [Araneus ventricosus]|uniref:Uncharacterized protein n=1 Tax=Araneus ventricosus TaxID=182803 RepID=A0A4Y2LJG0_ARAVE|nr:hypothetical protein AVEN_85598-1 [Araneus ventricosus]